MVDIVSLVKGDTVANLKVSLVREDNNTAFGIAEASTVNLHVRKKGTTTPVYTIPKDATLSSEASGILIFKMGTTGVFLDQNTVTEGYYEGEIELIFTDGTTQTVYETVPFQVRDDFS